MQRRTVGGDKVRTSYLDAGSGRPTILLHGTSSSAQTGWLPILPQLAERRRCLMPDLAGSGETPFEGPTLELDLLVEQVCDVAALVPEQAVDIIGYSLGAVVAAAAAARLRERVGRLVLIGGWATTDARMRLQFALWEALARSDRRQLAMLLLVNGVSQRYFEAAAPGAIDVILERVAPTLAAGTVYQAALDARIDIAPLLPDIRAETLVIGLKQDLFVPAQHGRALAQGIAGARHAEIDCGHLVMLEQPTQLLALIESHLGEAVARLPVR